MNTAKQPVKRTVWRALALSVFWMVFGFTLIQSLTVAVAWWQGGFRSLDFPEAVWVVLFPVLVFVYIRYFSVFRPGCATCGTPTEKSAQHLPRGP
jgi:hypothetical protein